MGMSRIRQIGHRLTGLMFLLLAPMILLQQRRLPVLFSKAYLLWRRTGLRGVFQYLWLVGCINIGYRRWISKFDSLQDGDRRAIANHIDILERKPVFSILLPTYNPHEHWLRCAIESVRTQLYPHWELCIADDASTDPHIQGLLGSYAALDARIKICIREHNGHISAASNSALAMATGEFIALLDHDDELSEHALYMAALAVNTSPSLNLIYSDEDKIDERGRRFAPYFKPDWNPELLMGQNTVSHLGIYRTELVLSLGGFREGVEGSQDWDLALRVTECIPSSTIQHIPHILYHWRTVAGSTSVGPGEKSYVYPASLRVVREHLQRTNTAGTVEPAFGSFIRVRHPLPIHPPLVSILVENFSNPLKQALLQVTYPYVEIVTSSQEELVPNLRFRQVGPKASRADFFNAAADEATGEVLLLIEAGFLPARNDWLAEMLSQVMRPGNGAIGPLLLNSNGAILSATAVLCNQPDGIGVMWSYYRNYASDEKGYGGRAGLAQNISVLPGGCLALRAEVFSYVGGADAAAFPEALFCQDLCLRLIHAGFRNVWTPYARFMSATESAACEHPGQDESRMFQERWGTYLRHDPAHNPNLSCGVEWPLPAFPPQIDKPWHKYLQLPA